MITYVWISRAPTSRKISYNPSRTPVRDFTSGKGIVTLPAWIHVSVLRSNAHQKSRSAYHNTLSSTINHKLTTFHSVPFKQLPCAIETTVTAQHFQQIINYSRMSHFLPFSTIQSELLNQVISLCFSGLTSSNETGI